jgi:hypothetical protein
MMARVANLTAVLALNGLSACALAQSQLTIGPATLTYPEIARQLCAPGRTVVCSRALHELGAFVCLKDRTWESATAILGEALSVRFRQQKSRSPAETVWRMEPDPAVQACESKWRESFAAALSAVMREPSGPQAQAVQRPFAVVVEEYSSKSRQLKKLHEDDPDEERPETQQIAEDVHSLGQITGPSGWAMEIMSHDVNAAGVQQAIPCSLPFEPIDIRRYLDVQGLAAVISRAEYIRSGESDYDDAELAERAAALARGDFAYACRVKFEPVSLSFTRQFLTRVGAYVDIESGSESALGDMSTDEFYSALARALGPDEAKKLTDPEAASRAFLKSDAAARGFDVNRGRDTTSVSQLLELWCAATGREAAMQLRPCREFVSLPTAETPNLETGGRNPPVTRTSLADQFRGKESSSDWTFCEKDGALLVSDRVGFVDSVIAFPMTAFLRLDPTWRSVPKKRGYSVESPSLAALEAYHASISDAENAAAGLDVPFRGIGLSDLSEFRPFVPLLRSFPPQQLRLLTNPENRTDGITLPLTGLGPAAVSEVVTTLRGIALANNRLATNSVLAPEIRRHLADWTFSIKPSNIAADVSTMKFSLVRRDGTGAAIQEVYDYYAIRP